MVRPGARVEGCAGGNTYGAVLRAEAGDAVVEIVGISNLADVGSP